MIKKKTPFLRVSFLSTLDSSTVYWSLIPSSSMSGDPYHNLNLGNKSRLLQILCRMVHHLRLNRMRDP